MTALPPLLAAGNPLNHVIDKPIGHHEQWWISNVTVMLIVSAVLTVLILVPAAKRIAAGIETGTNPRSRGVLANLVEAICVGLRDEIFKPILKDQTDKYMPILWTFFWFILICNLMGLVPILDLTAMIGVNTVFDGEKFYTHGIGGTATQSIWVTGGLAFVAFCFYNWQGLKEDPMAYFAHFTGGAPWYVAWIIVPVEIIGLFVKPFALAVRLFANMTGGHVLLAALFGFVPALGGALGAVGLAAGILPMIGAVAIYMLEVVVAFLQAFIFAFLTGLFLSQLVVHADHEDHEDHHGEPDHDLPGDLDNRGQPLQGPVPGASI